MQPERESFERQREEILEALHLIAEQKAKFVSESEIPLQWLRDEKALQKRLAAIEQQLAQLKPQPSPEPPPPQPKSSRWLIPSISVIVALVFMGSGLAWIVGANQMGLIPVEETTPSPVDVAPSPVDVAPPLVVGLQIEEARAILTAAGFTVVEVPYVDNRFPDGYVGDQNPLPDQLTPTGVVTLSVVLNGFLDDDDDTGNPDG